VNAGEELTGLSQEKLVSIFETIVSHSADQPPKEVGIYKIGCPLCYLFCLGRGVRAMCERFWCVVEQLAPTRRAPQKFEFSRCMGMGTLTCGHAYRESAPSDGIIVEV